MVDYKISINKECRNTFVIADNFSKYTFCITLKNKNSKTITDEFSNVLTKSKGKPLKIESDRVAEFCNSTFQNF